MTQSEYLGLFIFFISIAILMTIDSLWSKYLANEKLKIECGVRNENSNG